MAKRRNAPALFELLRDSNSTRTGQIGGEQLRTQLGGGTVKNTAPRPPGHPALKAEQEASAEAEQSEKAEQADDSQALASQVASETVVESKQSASFTSADTGSEVDPLLSMPTFKAGRKVAPKAEPEAKASTPESKPESKPEARTDSKPEPTKTPEPVVKQVEAPEVKAPAPKAESKPEPKPEARIEAPKVERTVEPEVGGSKPQKASKPDSTPEPEKMPETEAEASALPQDEVAAEEEGFDQAKYPLVKRVGNQMTFSTFTVGMIITAIPVIILVAYLIGTLVGTSTTKRDLAPMLRDQAENELSGLDVQPNPNTGEDASLRDPLNLTRDPEFTSPQGVVPTIAEPEGATEQAGAVDTGEEAAKESEPANTVQITNEDTRVDGQNYLHLAPLADPEEARRLQRFLAENGIQSFIREQYRGGRLGHEIITLVGIPSDEWSTSTKKIDHEREVKRLGGIWFSDFGGSIDFSRDNQSVWYKAKIDGS
jgi:hypothetical protein